MEHAAPKLPTPPERLLGIFRELGIAHDVHRHAPIFTVQEGEPLKASIPGLHCRNLFLCDKKKTMFLVVAANETAVDLKKLEGILGSARLSFGSPDRLWKYLGIYPGAVCPFAAVNDKNREVNIVLDTFMMRTDVVNYHPLDNAMTVSLSPGHLLKFFEYTGHSPKILDLSGAAPA